MFSFIQLQTDTIANAASNVVIEKIAPNTEISVLGFILKGGFFDSNCHTIVLYFLRDY